ncbi:MAG: hypothetical protein WCV00_23285, partial [Verrucomicrobiia bacterium]
MPHRTSQRPLGDFLQALREEKIDCILIGMMAAIHQGAPLMTLDYDFWLRLPVRQYIRVLRLVQRGATWHPRHQAVSRSSSQWPLSRASSKPSKWRRPPRVQNRPGRLRRHWRWRHADS